MDTQETRIFIAIIITAILLGIIIFYFVLTMIRQLKRNIALQKKNILAELQAMEKERARIAADLHDDLGPILSVTKFQVDFAKQSQRVEKEELDKASEHLDTLIERIREIANDLMPTALQRKGLVPALEEFISQVNSTGPLQIKFTHDTIDALGEDKVIHIYRTVQELIHNCIRHAAATNLEIQLHKKNGTLRLLCRDNGKGFNVKIRTAESTGIGLRSLKNRTEILGGAMAIESKPAKGTAFLFTIPV